MNNSNDGIRLGSGGQTYWFTEGFTDYLTVKLMHEAGLVEGGKADFRAALAPRGLSVEGFATDELYVSRSER